MHLMGLMIAVIYISSCGHDVSFFSGQLEPRKKKTSNVEAQRAPQKSIVAKGVTALKKLSCASSDRQTMRRVIQFPQRQGCEWGERGNLLASSKTEGILAARHEVKKTISLDDNSKLCGLSISSVSRSFHYDDFSFLNLNDKVLIGSNKYFSKELAEEASMKVWNWDSLVGQKWSFRDPEFNEIYCALDSDCRWPRHDESGDVFFELDLEEKHIESFENRTRLDFSLITTGDNNPSSDCSNDELRLEINVEFVN